MLGIAAKSAHVPIAASKAGRNEGGRRFVSIQQFARPKTMNLSRFGSFRLPGQREVTACASQVQIDTSEGVWENQRFYYAFGWCEITLPSVSIFLPCTVPA